MSFDRRKIVCGLAILIYLVAALSGCYHAPLEEQSACNMVQLGLQDAELPRFYDDASNASLDKALTESIAFWQEQDRDSVVKVCDRTYKAGWMLKSLLDFQELLHTLPEAELPEIIAEKFNIFQAQNSGVGPEILVTGYFQPTLKGSLVRKPPFIYPIYRLPPDLIVGRRYDVSGISRQIIGRLQNGRFLPYWRRSEIEKKDLLAGRELLYLQDPVDAFVLQIQGSGLIELQDGSVRQVRYAGSNGWPYKSIGKLLADEGSMNLAEVSLPKIRQYLASHLDERQRILHYNDRYVFFSLAPDGLSQGAVGSMGHELAPGRSVALDTRCFPLGGLCYLESEAPEIADGRMVGWRPLQRFVLAQDSGAAIKGSGRLDMFWGHGRPAAIKAGNMRQPGRLYLLVEKQTANMAGPERSSSANH